MEILHPGKDSWEMDLQVLPMFRLCCALNGEEKRCVPKNGVPFFNRRDCLLGNNFLKLHLQ